MFYAKPMITQMCDDDREGPQDSLCCQQTGLEQGLS